MKLAVAAMILAAGITAPATAHADCGDPGQDPCTGPVPTVDQVVAVLAELTDPDIPAASKTNIVTPGFSPDEAGTIDDHLNRMRRPALPLHFVVTNIQPAPNNFAGATVETGGNRYQHTWPRSIVLVEEDGRWKITHDTAMPELHAFWLNGSRPPWVCRRYLT